MFRVYCARDLKFAEFSLLDSLQGKPALREAAPETGGQGPGGQGAGMSAMDTGLEGRTPRARVGWSPEQPCQCAGNARDMVGPKDLIRVCLWDS